MSTRFALILVHAAKGATMKSLNALKNSRATKRPDWVRLILPPWKNYIVPAKRSIRSLAGYRSHEQEAIERGTRVSLLKQGTPASCALADYLDAFDAEESADVLCCPILGLQFKEWFVSESIRVFSRWPDSKLRIVTLCQKSDDIPFGKLRKSNLRRTKMRLRRQIERSVSKYAVVLGCNEVSPDFEHKVWQVHHHLLFANCKSREIRRLREFHRRGIRNHKPLVIQRLKDPMRQIAYAAKLVCFYRPVQQQGAIRPPGRRLPLRRHNEHMRFMARRSVDDLIFAFNVSRNRGPKFRINPKVVYSKTN